MNTPGSVKRPRLHYLDGIRGLAALIVALYHAQLFTGRFVPIQQLWPVLQPLGKIISFGYLAVPLFIVLSGYCLAIPVVLHDKKQIKGGFKTYISRRAKRILPPYYFALGLFIIMILCIPVLQTPAQTAWDSKIPMTPIAVITHLLLVHNLKSEWTFKIAGPLWSVATEWQLYFLFPVLLYLWRRFNLLLITLGCILLTIITAVFVGPANTMHLWFLGLFALGVTGANISFSQHADWVKLHQLNWRIIANVSLLITIAILTLSKYIHLSYAVLETVIGFAALILIIYYSKTEIEDKPRPLFQKLLNKRTLIYLGTFSYSVYLIHSPFLGLINLLTLNITMEPGMRWLFMQLVAVPLSIGVSYLFYILIEKRFILTPAKS